MENKVNPTNLLKDMKDLPKAIIVDIDGTLAKMNGRGPFEWMRVGEDEVNEPIKIVVDAMNFGFYGDLKIIIFSGRDSICREQTVDWLLRKNIPYDFLFMRPQGNNEKDSIIKRRLFDEHINGKYDVLFVLDDRNQVVDMWRKDLGLTCLQVDYGDF